MYSCLNPVRIFNKHLGKYVFVDCDTCEACKNRRMKELSARVSKEMDYCPHVLFVTLTYDNEHLPVYRFDGCKYYSTAQDYDYTSSEEQRFKPIDSSDVDIKCNPIGFDDNDICFGHLNVEDVQKFIKRLRGNVSYYCKTNKLNNDEYKCRYFVCGEYGPTTLRPHYHILLFLTERDALKVYSEIIPKSWQIGRIDVQQCTTNTVSNYLANYVTSTSNLPYVLQRKSIRPFCVFSKAPVIGCVQIGDDEIQKLFFKGITRRTKWDSKTQSFVDDYLPKQVYNRYFPKCQGFSYKSYFEKLRVYSYVFNYFKDTRRTHGVEEVDKLRLVDIPFPVREVYNPELNKCVMEEWSYQDKFCALQSYRSCVKYNCSPEFVLQATERVYQNCSSVNLRRFYEYQENVIQTQGDIRFTINTDREFISNLPCSIDNLELWQYNALESYGIDVSELYPDGTISEVYLLSLDYHNDPNYLSFRDKALVFYNKSKQSKERNQYLSKAI